MATTLERIQPYVEQVFDNDDVRANVARMSANLRAARSRADSRKSVSKAAQDPGVRARLLESARAGRAAVQAVREGPQKQSPWPRRARLVLAMAVAAGAGAAYQAGRGTEAGA